ncbi:hypothetical protein HZC21_00130 [Candidatus Peregrinibacteria bacterium]|nr:hypothetical protein [Candidatus Peregrinibacteria bacterium]
MSYKKYLLILVAVSIIGWISWLLVIFRLDPCTAPGEITICHSISALALILFFLSGFFALSSTITLLNFLLRIWLQHDEIYIDHFNVSLRQGILLALCALGALGLLLINALTWWSGFLLIFIVVLLELYFSRQN